MKLCLCHLKLHKINVSITENKGGVFMWDAILKDEFWASDPIFIASFHIFDTPVMLCHCLALFLFKMYQTTYDLLNKNSSINIYLLSMRITAAVGKTGKTLFNL